jgi:hypothetical protein
MKIQCSVYALQTPGSVDMSVDCTSWIYQAEKSNGRTRGGGVMVTNRCVAVPGIREWDQRRPPAIGGL